MSQVSDIQRVRWLRRQQLTTVRPALAFPSQARPSIDTVDLFEESARFITGPELLSDPDVDTFGKVLCLVTLYAKPAANYAGEASYYNRRDSGKKTYEKMIVTMDINADEGNNLIIFHYGKGQNEVMFDKSLAQRDNGEMGEFID